MEIVIQQVSKRYKGNVWGLRNFNLTLRPGVLGLLGPNGAGKTTLMNILSTVTTPTEGTVTWNGTDIAKNPHDLRRVLGYLPQDFGVYPNLTAQEFLLYMAAVKGIDATVAKKRIDELLALVDLTHVRNRTIGGFSGGMRQRVGVVQALLNDPQLLIVDEPTVGLDPESRVQFRNLLSDLSGERIVILSTHIVSDIEATATDIALIKGGQLLKHDSPEGMLRFVEGKVWGCVIPNDELPTFRKKYLVSNTLRRSDGIHVRVVTTNPPDSSAKPLAPSLEDAYLYSLAWHEQYGKSSAA